MENYRLMVVKKSDWRNLSLMDQLQAALLILDHTAKNDADAADWFESQLALNSYNLTEEQREKALDTVRTAGIDTLCYPYHYFTVLV